MIIPGLQVLKRLDKPVPSGRTLSLIQEIAKGNSPLPETILASLENKLIAGARIEGICWVGSLIDVESGTGFEEMASF